MRSNTTLSIKDLSKHNFLSPKFKLLNISNTVNQVSAINIDYINDKLSNNIIQTEINEIYANTLLISAQADNYYEIGMYLTNVIYDTGNLANVAVANASYIAEHSNTVNNWVILVSPIINSRFLIANTIYNNISNISSNIISALNISTNAYSIASGIYNKALLALNSANTANDLTILSLPLADTANDISLTIETKCDEVVELSNNISQLASNISIFTANTSNLTFSISNTAILALNLSTNAFSIATESFLRAQNANTIANSIYTIAITASDIANTANLTAYNTILTPGNASLLISGTINSYLLGSNVLSSSILYGNNTWKPLNANLTSIINLSTIGWTYRFANNVWINKTSPTFTTANINVDIQQYSVNISNTIMSSSEIITGTNTTLKSSSPLIIAEAVRSTSTVMETPVGGKIYESSGTFTPIISKMHRIIVIGAGGSGAATRVSSNGNADLTSIGMACGGGAGGCAIKDILLSSGVTYTVTIGSGGSSKIVSGTLSSTSGSSGGSSSFSGSGISTITASGGGGGQGQSGASGGLSKSGGSGGSSSGGDFNFIGGNGGNCYYVAYGGKCSTGGGSVSVVGTTYSAGNCTEGDIPFGYDQTTIRYYPGATGGAGIGGSSGQIETYAGAYAYCATGGGGSEEPSNSLINPGSGTTSGGSASLLFKFNIMYINNSGGNAGYPAGSSAYDGGGGGGGVMNEGNCSGGNGGMFGGGGAACCGGGGGGPSAYNATAGNGGIGAGGGGALSMLGTAKSGSGGKGLIIILW